MLPRPRRPHDQLLRADTGETGSVRSVVVAGIGGLVLGHMLWLLGISAAMSAQSVSTAVLVVSAILLAGAGLAIYRAWRSYQRTQLVQAAFFGGLAASPVIFTIIVLGVTYL